MRIIQIFSDHTVKKFNMKQFLQRLGILPQYESKLIECQNTSALRISKTEDTTEIKMCWSIICNLGLNEKKGFGFHFGRGPSVSLWSICYDLAILFSQYLFLSWQKEETQTILWIMERVFLRVIFERFEHDNQGNRGPRVLRFT